MWWNDNFNLFQVGFLESVGWYLVVLRHVGDSSIHSQHDMWVESFENGYIYLLQANFYHWNIKKILYFMLYFYQIENNKGSWLIRSVKNIYKQHFIRFVKRNNNSKWNLLFSQYVTKKSCSLYQQCWLAASWCLCILFSPSFVQLLWPKWITKA